MDLVVEQKLFEDRRMKKILIMTYCTWTSIGSMLQALGLKKALLRKNYDSVILLKKGENDFQKIKVNSIKRLLIRMHQILIYKKRISAFDKRNRFMNENLDIEYFADEIDLEKRVCSEDIECAMAGSDQIWNPINKNDLFFLSFVKDKRKISYAASMGTTILDDKSKKFFESYINTFDCISVREKECKNVLKSLTEKNIEVNIDPVFLCEKDEWRKYEVPYPVTEPYILLYMLFWDGACKEKIKQLKKKTGLLVIAISNQLSKVYADKIIYDVGPGEFLWLIDHAEYVVSSSFHGVAFSTIFNKKFSAIINPASPSRIQHLMRILEIPNIKIEELCDSDSFDYVIINRHIKENCVNSNLYLEKAIMNE